MVIAEEVEIEKNLKKALYDTKEWVADAELGVNLLCVELARENKLESFRYKNQLKKFSKALGWYLRRIHELETDYEQLKPSSPKEYKERFRGNLYKLRVGFGSFLKGSLEVFFSKLGEYKIEGEQLEKDIEKIRGVAKGIDGTYETLKELEYEPSAKETIEGKSVEELVSVVTKKKKPVRAEAVAVILSIALVLGFGVFKFVQLRTGVEQAGPTGFAIIPSSLTFEFLYVLIFSAIIGIYIFSRLMKKWNRI